MIYPLIIGVILPNTLNRDTVTFCESLLNNWYDRFETGYEPILTSPQKRLLYTPTKNSGKLLFSFFGVCHITMYLYIHIYTHTYTVYLQEGFVQMVVIRWCQDHQSLANYHANPTLHAGCPNINEVSYCSIHSTSTIQLCINCAKVLWRYI